MSTQSLYAQLAHPAARLPVGDSGSSTATTTTHTAVAQEDLDTDVPGRSFRDVAGVRPFGRPSGDGSTRPGASLYQLMGDVVADFEPLTTTGSGSGTTTITKVSQESADTDVARFGRR